MHFTLIMFNPDMSNEAIELEGEGEDVVVVRRIPHDEGPIGFVGQHLLCCFPADWTPIPPTLAGEGGDPL